MRITVRGFGGGATCREMGADKAARCILGAFSPDVQADQTVPIAGRHECLSKWGKASSHMSSVTKALCSSNVCLRRTCVVPGQPGMGHVHV